MKWYDVEVRPEDVKALATQAFGDCILSEKLAYFVLASLWANHQHSSDKIDDILSGERYNKLRQDYRINDSIPLYLRLMQGASKLSFDVNYLLNWNVFSAGQKQAVLGIDKHFPNYCKYLLADLYTLLKGQITNEPIALQIARTLQVTNLDTEQLQFWMYILTNRESITRVINEGICEITVLQNSPIHAGLVTEVDALPQEDINWYNQCDDDAAVYRLLSMFRGVEHGASLMRFIYGVLASEFDLYLDGRGMSLNKLMEIFSNVGEDCPEQLDVARNLVTLIYNNPQVEELPFTVRGEVLDLINVTFVHHTKVSELTAVDRYILYLMQENMNTSDTWYNALRDLISNPFRSAGASLLAEIFFGYYTVREVARGFLVSDMLISHEKFSPVRCSFHTYPEALRQSLGMPSGKLISKRKELLGHYTSTLPENLQELSDADKLTYYFMTTYNK